MRTRPWPSYERGDALLDRSEEEAVLQVIRSRRLFRYDGRPLKETPVGRFERRAADVLGARYALAVSTGTAALSVREKTI